ncbi:RNA polymerase sigma factor [Parapedobacter indicus]|uniref:RNA polymerase sigma-70 factor, ECF subfamily n=1 Tax=Parapedobacter indicus TaxID=1477437 RepID=A0A1I3CFQ4_9SPHI|nr:RNA polymerase sigma-70 factor [Parapedobacter indicus]PPL04225.1 RNA polymerase sigma-70 factor (ECF subfamily) [Parapedobacter indicus]SFH73233.1 RNA polymerase sigma-70 factor, ECF subfamily [Parapedobacter indicus]
MDDSQLVLQFKAGNEAAYKALFDRFNKRLLYVAEGIVYDRNLAEDIVQEVFWKLWDRRVHFNEVQSIRAFLYLSVKNACRNHYKHEKVIEKYRARQGEPIEDDVVLSKIIEAEVMESLYHAIEKLPTGCREVVHLRYFEGMSIQEVAEQLNISVNTVKTQKMRALRSLRLQLRTLSVGMALLIELLLMVK